MSASDFEDATSFRSLVAAARRASRGKRSRGPVASFLSDLEREVLALQDELRSGAYRPGPSHTFTIYEPKQRLISAASFRDRVVHHAVCAVLEPRLERAATSASFACRRGLGPVAALSRVRGLVGRHAFVLRLDVRRFFASIDHDVLLAALRPKVEDPRLFALLECTVQCGSAPGGRGLPIGALTSQHFANLYLAPLDNFILRTLRLDYVRYMDDMAVFADEKATLWAAHDRISTFVAARLRLELKPSATRLLPVTDGVPWLGFRVWPGQVRLDGVHLRRLSRALGHIGRALDAGRMTEERGGARAAGVLSYAAHADIRAWCRAYVARRAEGRGPSSRRETRDEW